MRTLFSFFSLTVFLLSITVPRRTFADRTLCDPGLGVLAPSAPQVAELEAAPLLDLVPAQLIQAEYSRRIGEAMKSMPELSRDEAAAVRKAIADGVRAQGPTFVDDKANIREAVTQNLVVKSPEKISAVIENVDAAVAAANAALLGGEVAPQKRGRRLRTNAPPKKEPPPAYVHKPDEDGLFPLIAKFRKINPQTGEPTGELREERRKGNWTDEAGYKLHPEIHRVQPSLFREDGAIDLPDGTYNFVVTADDAVLLGIQNARYPHPSLLGGKNPRVKLAGEIVLKDGKILLLNNSSGHFQTSELALQQHGPLVLETFLRAARQTAGRDIDVRDPTYRMESDPDSASNPPTSSRTTEDQK